MTKPSWNTAPEWAKHLTFDTSKRWLWSENKPELKKFGMAFDFDSMGRFEYVTKDADVWYTEEKPIGKVEVAGWLSRVFAPIARGMVKYT